MFFPFCLYRITPAKTFLDQIKLIRATRDLPSGAPLLSYAQKHMHSTILKKVQSKRDWTSLWRPVAGGRLSMAPSPCTVNTYYTVIVYRWYAKRYSRWISKLTRLRTIPRVRRLYLTAQICRPMPYLVHKASTKALVFSRLSEVRTLLAAVRPDNNRWKKKYLRKEILNNA